MIRKIKFLILLVAFIELSECESREYFTVTGSQLLKTNKPYRAFVFYQGYENETTLEISLLNGNNVEDSKQVKLLGTDFNTVELNVSCFTIIL
jgi:hypothetical protein